MPRKQSETTDSIVFNGITFRRYPNAKRLSDRKYYRADGRLRKQGISYLHREVWKFYNGEIPEGYHVHHKDENTLNNDISNLELLKGESHLSMHAKENYDNREFKEGNSRQLDAIRAKAAEWHKSEAGRSWHKQHAIEIAQSEKAKGKIELVCAVCGKKYLAPHNQRNRSKFCSNACYAKYRRDSGIDNEIRKCPICGAEYSVNRYSKQKTCGRKECHVRSMLNNRKKHI